MNPIKLTTPCLLPSNNEISHLCIDSERYFPVQIDSSSLYLRKMGAASDSSFSILVKKKSGVLSYAQDPYSLRSLLVQSGVCKSGSALKLIKLFTEDPLLLAFAEYLCDSESQYRREVFSVASNQSSLGMGYSLETFCTSILHECLTEGKTDALPLFLSLWCCIMSLKKKSKPVVSLVWDIRLIESYYDRFEHLWSDIINPPGRILNTDFVAILIENVDRIFAEFGMNETQIKYHKKFKDWESIKQDKGIFGSFLVWNKL